MPLWGANNLIKTLMKKLWKRSVFTKMERWGCDQLYWGGFFVFSGWSPDRTAENYNHRSQCRLKHNSLTVPVENGEKIMTLIIVSGQGFYICRKPGKGVLTITAVCSKLINSQQIILINSSTVNKSYQQFSLTTTIRC